MRQGAFVFSETWKEVVGELPETGMGYTVVSITLHDGRTFRQVLIDSGHLCRVRGVADVPFTENDIAAVAATHEKWDWKEAP